MTTRACRYGKVCFPQSIPESITLYHTLPSLRSLVASVWLPSISSLFSLCLIMCPRVPFISEYLKLLATVNQIIALCDVLDDEISDLRRHKLVAHQLALLYVSRYPWPSISISIAPYLRFPRRLNLCLLPNLSKTSRSSAGGICGMSRPPLSHSLISSRRSPSRSSRFCPRGRSRGQTHPL